MLSVRAWGAEEGPLRCGNFPCYPRRMASNSPTSAQSIGSELLGGRYSIILLPPQQSTVGKPVAGEAFELSPISIVRISLRSGHTLVHCATQRSLRPNGRSFPFENGGPWLGRQIATSLKRGPHKAGRQRLKKTEAAPCRSFSLARFFCFCCIASRHAELNEKIRKHEDYRTRDRNSQIHKTHK